MSEQPHDPRRGPVSRLLSAIGRKPAEIPVSNADEPCIGCGEETTVGSVFYSDRRSITRSDGATVFLCSDCQAMAHHARKGEPLTDADLRTIADNGFMIGAGFVSGGGSGAGF